MQLKELAGVYDMTAAELRILMLKDEDYFDANITDNKNPELVEVNDQALTRLQEIVDEPKAQSFVSIGRIAEVLNVSPEKLSALVAGRNDLKTQYNGKFISFLSIQKLLKLAKKEDLSIEPPAENETPNEESFMPLPKEPDKVSDEREVEPVKKRGRKKEKAEQETKQDIPGTTPVDADAKADVPESIPAEKKEAQKKLSAAEKKKIKEQEEKRGQLEEIFDGQCANAKAARKIAFESKMLPVDELVLMTDDEVSGKIGEKYVSIPSGNKTILVKKEAFYSILDAVTIIGE